MLSKTLALAIAIVLFVELLRDKRPRYLVSLCAGCWMLVLLLLTHPPAVLEALSLHSFLTPRFWFAHGGVTELNVGINWSTMFFLTGMMVLVEGMGEAGFFDWVSLRLARALGFRPMAILLSFMILAALLAMFVDSVTVILFLVAATVRLAQYLRFDPVPLIIGEIFAANLGGAATMTGDPPNIIIGTALGYTFTDFIQNTGVIVGICFVFVLLFFWLCFRKELLREERANGGPVVCPEPSSAITDRRAFGASAAVFLLAVVLLVTHAQTGLTVACIGVIVAALTLLVMALSHGRATVLEVIRGVDYKTLLFFIGLFVSVCGLEKTGVLDIIARFITNISGGHVATIVVIILWLSAVTSAFVDNIPFAATMIPVIRSIAAVEGMDVGVLAWALSLGTDLGGNATPIGASANVVGTSVSAKGGYPIGWGRYCKYCVPATILVMAVSTVCLFLRYL